MGVRGKALRASCALLVLTIGLVGSAHGQSGSAAQDSLRFYELSEIVVGDERDAQRAARTGSARRVPLADIVRADASDVAGLTRLIPSAHLQTNSRGESLIYVRNAGERQVSVFLDGALLNVPWDHRVDLSAVPASVLGGLQVIQGASSVLYGTNVLGGAVNLSTRSMEGEGAHSELIGVGGSGGYLRMDGMHQRRKGRTSVLAAAGYNRTDGTPLGSNADLPFGQSGTVLRDNTDRRIAHGFARATRSLERGLIGFSVLHVDAQKGVAPEGHLDPSVESVRYWRYPDWRTTLVSANALLEPSDKVSVRAATWVSEFSQRIDQYPSIGFSGVEEQQQDVDRTLGARVTAERSLGRGVVRGALHGLLSTHRQQDSVLEQGDLRAAPREVYRQATGSSGLELGTPLGTTGRTRFVVGGNLDLFAMPETAGKPGPGTFVAWGATSGIERDLTAATQFRASIGRKVRFPTMRELFGTALDRFVVNEDLRPESALLVDAGLHQTLEDGAAELTLFLNRTWDTIDQENVDVNGQRLRRRINLEGSRVIGLEVLGQKSVRGVDVEGALTFSRPLVLGQTGRSRLTEKPEVLGRGALRHSPRRGVSIGAEVVYTGRAYGLNPANQLEKLPQVLQINVRASARRYTSARVFVEGFVRADNLTDRSVFPQLGLPGPGRSLQLGVSLAY